MTPIVIGTLVFICTFGGALVGIWLRATLPDHHLSDDSKDTVKVGIGLIATMTALVLGPGDCLSAVIVAIRPIPTFTVSLESSLR